MGQPLRAVTCYVVVVILQLQSPPIYFQLGVLHSGLLQSRALIPAQETASPVKDPADG